MSDGERRNLLQSWCVEGSSLAEASRVIGAEEYEQTRAEFDGASSVEARAALYLHLFTTHRPLWRDRDGLQGAVDIVLIAANGSKEAVEVTSTLEDQFMSAHVLSELLAVDIAERYSGSSSWLMHLAHGWEPPRTTRTRHALAMRIAEELEAFHADGRTDGTLESADWIRVRRGDGDASRVEVVSWSANIPDSGDVPYLDRLTTYLGTSSLIARKREKLVREAIALGTQKRHLYLLMSATGAGGGLLPASPSYMTWGQFSPPEDLTDIWLDGGTGQIYHWNDDAGWRFHRLQN
jgi:hypothetical protein